MPEKGDQLLTDDMLPLRLETHDEVAGPGHRSYPRELEWSWHADGSSVTMTVTNVEMIEALDMSGAHHGLEHALLHAFDHPMYYNFNADMELRVKLERDRRDGHRADPVREDDVPLTGMCRG